MGMKIKMQILIFLVGLFLGTTIGAFGMHWFKEKVDVPKTTQHLKIGKIKSKGKGNHSDIQLDQKQTNSNRRKRKQR